MTRPSPDRGPPRRISRTRSTLGKVHDHEIPLGDRRRRSPARGPDPLVVAGAEGPGDRPDGHPPVRDRAGAGGHPRPPPPPVVRPGPLGLALAPGLRADPRAPPIRGIGTGRHASAERIPPVLG